MSQYDNRVSIKGSIQLSSTQQSPSRKYNYYTNTIRNSAVSTSSIDNHRNSIEQRIANLQAKICQKYNKMGESRKDRVTVSQHYVSVNLQSGNNKNSRVQLKQSMMDKPLPSQTVVNKNKHVNSVEKMSRPQSSQVSKSINQHNLPIYTTPVSNLRNGMNSQLGLQRQTISNQNMNSNNKYNYLTEDNNNDKGDSIKQTNNFDNRCKEDHNRDKDRVPQNRPIVSRNSKQYNNLPQNILYNNISKNSDVNYYKTLNFTNNKTATNQFQPQPYRSKYPNPYQYQTHSTSVQQNNKQKQSKQNNYPDLPKTAINQNKEVLPNEKPSNNRIKNQTYSLPKPSQPLFSYQNTIPQIQQKYTNLSRTISSLRKQPKLYDNFINQSNLNNLPISIPPSTLRDNNTQKGHNTQLYQMMKTILLGQQRLEKQLELIKKKQAQMKNSAIKGQELYLKDFDRLPLRQKKYTNPKITETSHFKPNINSVNTSPLKNNKQKSSKSPLQQKNTNDKQNSKSQQGSGIKQRRCNSAAQSKSKTGKITKNKQQQFMELYKQAQKSKHLSPLNTRISISQQSISSVWDRIKSVIERSSIQDIESSKVYHQNNRYINDHLVNTIELQRKLKNDLVKKVYDMCENKCLFK